MQFEQDDFWNQVSQNLLATRRPETPAYLNGSPIRPESRKNLNNSYFQQRPDTAASSIQAVRLQPIINAPQPPSLSETQSRLRATQERRRQRRLNIVESKFKRPSVNKKHEKVPRSPNSPKSARKPQKPQNSLRFSRNSTNIALRDSVPEDIQESEKPAVFRPTPPSSASSTRTKTENSDKSLSQALEIIQNSKKTYTKQEQVRACQMAMKLQPGSNNSLAISLTMFQIAEKDTHLVANPSMIRDLLSFLAITGSKKLERYSQAVLYIIGTLRLVTTSWKNANSKLDFSEICDELVEYTTLVIDVVLHSENEHKDGIQYKKILIQSTGLLSNAADRMGDAKQFQFHGTFDSLFVILRRFYKEQELILQVSRILTSFKFDEISKIQPDTPMYLNYFVFALEESNSDDYFTLKILYLLGNLTENVGTGLDFELVGKQLKNIITSILKENCKSCKTSQKREIVLKTLRLLGNLAMEENYLDNFVNDKMIATLLKILLVNDEIPNELIFGVIHNLSAWENNSVEKGDAGETNNTPPIFFQIMINDLLMDDGGAFFLACDQFEIVNMASMASISKYVQSEKEANRILQIAINGLLQESSSVIYNSLGSILNLSNSSFIALSDTLLCNLLCVLDDCLTQSIHFPMMVCRILDNLLNSGRKYELEQSTVINIVSILQDIADDETTNDILSEIISKLPHSHDSKQIMYDWQKSVVPLSIKVLSVL